MRAELERRAALGEVTRKLVFLDVDGVLHAVQGRDIFTNVPAFSRLIRATGAQVVLSSAWRLNERYMAHLNAELMRNGLKPVIGTTGVASRGGLFGLLGGVEASPAEERVQEIREWLELYGQPGDRWLVLDDLDMMVSFGEQLILTDPHMGLSESDANQAIQYLNRKSSP